MFGSRSRYDEEMLRFIGLCNSTQLNSGGFVEIHDARPIVNARVNMVTGGGYEECGLNSNYSNCRLTFADIENIHQVRDSFKKVYDLAYIPVSANERWLSSHWFK